MSLPSNITQIQSELQIDRVTYNVLKETLYPGAKDESISMIINYCRARKLDPIKKPVHLVPMSVKSGRKDAQGKDIYEYRDVVMPGIGLYRIEADRSGQYAGMSEPEFGPDVTEKVGSVTMTFPKWCKVTVRKKISDNIVDFTALEFWKENYATKNRTDLSPNAMWEKRAYGQLAKCAEAQALRKAFPDVIGQDYTKEEMEGKSFHEPRDEVKPKIIEGEKVNDSYMSDFIDFNLAIKNCETEDQLRAVFEAIKKADFGSQPDLFKKLIEAKDKRKGEIMTKQFTDEMDADTGEVK